MAADTQADEFATATTPEEVWHRVTEDSGTQFPFTTAPAEPPVAVQLVSGEVDPLLELVSAGTQLPFSVAPTVPPAVVQT